VSLRGFLPHREALRQENFHATCLLLWEPLHPSLLYERLRQPDQGERLGAVPHLLPKTLGVGSLLPRRGTTGTANDGGCFTEARLEKLCWVISVSL
jgi:hypothetical protein